MQANPNPSPAGRSFLQRLARNVLRAAAALAAALGLGMKPGTAATPPAATPQDTPPERPRGGGEARQAERSGAMHTLLQGSWSQPPQLRVGVPDAADAKPKFDDLGFISHIDSGFNDFYDRNA